MTVPYIVRKCFSVCLSIVLLSMVACKATKEVSSFVVVNVLDTEFHNDCHIKESFNVPFMELEKYADEHWDKNKTQIVLYCGNYKCTASGYGARMLREKGFKYVWAYEGGTAEWIQKGFSVVGPCKEAYLQEYELPEGVHKKMKEENDIVITAEELHKKMLEFK